MSRGRRRDLASSHYDRILCCGDIVGYGPEPDAVVDRLASAGALGVRGNHDAAACGEIQIDWFNPEARSAMEWTRGAISEATRSWLRGLPERRQEGDFTLVHGSGRDPTWEYVTSAVMAHRSLAAMTTRHGLNGHTHIPVAFLETGDRIGRAGPDGDPGDTTISFEDGRVLLNPGSVGQPRDGDPRASYLILDTDAMTATWQRVAYDVAAVDAAMRAVGLPSRLAERLHHGL